jgi:hypothetical protein
MPTADALCGIGFSAQEAERLGENYSALTCAGTTQAAAAKVLSRDVELTAASSQTGAIIPSTAEIMDVFYFFNSSATTAVVYAPASTTLNGAASTTGLNVAQNKGAIFWQYKKGAWASIVAA